MENKTVDKAFVINEATIMHDIIDGEAIIVNLENGYYYSLDGVGAQVWQQVVAGHSAGSIASDLSARYLPDNESVASDLSAFLQQLEDEGLVLAVDSSSVQATALELLQIPYTKPDLQKYTDMDVLLLLDPIHEVDDAGWPQTK